MSGPSLPRDTVGGADARYTAVRNRRYSESIPCTAPSHALHRCADLVVQKYGGSSLASLEQVESVADRVAALRRRVEFVVVVVSARGGTTNELLELGRRLCPAPPARELDVLVSTGEVTSAALLSLSLAGRGIAARALTGGQAGIRTCATHGEARILAVDPAAVLGELQQGSVAVVAGFQGVTGANAITTLGRGSSDTTAVALAAALGATSCDILTDVPGVYSADPRSDPTAALLPHVSYEAMLDLSANGARVIHSDAVALARRRGIELYVGPWWDERFGSVVNGHPYDASDTGGLCQPPSSAAACGCI